MREEGDKRLIYNEFPKLIKALVIHKKYTAHDNVAYCVPEKNTWLECTLLGERGLTIPNYEKALFTRESVNQYIMGGKNQLIVDNIS